MTRTYEVRRSGKRIHAYPLNEYGSRRYNDIIKQSPEYPSVGATQRALRDLSGWGDEHSQDIIDTWESIPYPKRVLKKKAEWETEVKEWKDAYSASLEDYSRLFSYTLQTQCHAENLQYELDRIPLWVRKFYKWWTGQ